MRELPILMMGWSVKRILPGLKTQTRRVVKPQPHRTMTDAVHIASDGWEWRFGEFTQAKQIRCPYGSPGDLLWVKETYTVEPLDMMDCNHKVIYRADGAERELKGDQYCGPGFAIDGPGVAEDYPWDKYGVWRPSIFMFKWAARLWLINTEVRVQRVQDINREDGFAEGIERDQFVATDSPVAEADWLLGRVRKLWNSINEKPREAKRNPYTNQPELCQVAYPWDDVREETIISKKSSKFDGCTVYIVGNPYVWAISFEIDEERSVLG